MDKRINSFASIGLAAPTFYVALLFIYYFGLKLDLFPVMGMHSFGDDSFEDFLHHLVLPYSALNPNWTVKELIQEPLKNAGFSQKQCDDRVKELLKLVNMNEEDMHKFSYEFSGGQRQRIGIARAVANYPDFIFCDEPISALDVSVQAQVVNMLKDLQQEMGLTYLFTAHDLSMVHHISDRIGVMYLGSMVELGTSEDVFEHPLHPYTKALISAIPIADPELGRQNKRIPIQGELPSPMNAPKGCRFCTRCPYATERCREERPEFREIKPGHFARCHIL